MSEHDTAMEGYKSNDFKEKNLSIVSEWLIKFQSNTLLESDFRNYWKIWVPRILKPVIQGDSLFWSFDEQKVEQILFNTLEEFICSENSIEALHGLTQQSHPLSVCGKVFKIGDPTYCCRECGMDSTCALCVDCFKLSSHKNHKYKMGTSLVSGYCVCGDIESWKQDAYCQTHKLGLEKKIDILNFSTNDLEKRAHLVFQYVLCYARALLTIEHPPMLPAELDCNKMLNDSYSIYQNQEDSFCIVLYNDEVHTNHDVKTMLTRFVKCQKIKSTEYVTTVDYEGRAVVKCGSFEQCENLKKKIENFIFRFGGTPLRMVVVHLHVVVHQIYALRLLAWMQNLLRCSERLRTVFSDVVLANTPGGCIIESILRKNSALWKSARLHWHELFIVGMFIEYENKKKFAKIFTQNYGEIMKDFINDDHNYSYSVASLSVHIFNVPTLANYLIAHNDVLDQLLNTFLSECSRLLNKQGKLEFKHKTSTSLFKRAQYILGDIRDLLGCVPKTWNPELRVSFCHAVSLVLKVLGYMQNMCTVARYAKFQHDMSLTCSSEWKHAFDFYANLRPLIANILSLCGSDSIVLKKVYRMTLEKIWENPVLDPTRPTVVRELNNYKVSCIDYDVSIELVSIHLPLSRFLAGLHLHLDQYGLSFDHSELQTAKQSPVQIIEPVLRTLVLISQKQAGMWVYNGFSFTDQLSRYSDSQMGILDKDIVILQMGASLIDSNEFLIHVLNKFNLLTWTQPSFEQNISERIENKSIQQLICLVEKFLTLIITIVGERYTLGVGKVTFEDCIKKKVIQLLCIRPMTYLELNKTLINIVNDEERLEKAINEVAVFKKIGGKEVYELKPAYYDNYNVFFYHYSKEEMSISEEEQKKRRRAANELECCPPPCLPLFSDGFAKIVNIMQCDIMFYIMKLILDRTLNLKSRSFSKSQLHKVLYLIGYALREEENQKNPSFLFTKRAESYGIEIALEDLRRSPRGETYRDLVLWTLNKFKQVSGPKRLSIETVVTDDVGDVESEDTELEKQKRAQLAAKRRASVMGRMVQMQNNFLKNNPTLFDSTPTNSESHHDSTSMDDSKNIGELSVALGPYQTSSSTCDKKLTCIFCHEEQLLTHDSQAMVLTTFVQKSSVLCQQRSSLENAIDHVSDPYYIPANFGPSPYISTCGHVLHFSCWQKYYDKILANEKRRFKPSSRFDVYKSEYLCPLCKRLCNTVMPLLPPNSSLKEPENMKSFENVTFDSWLEGLNIALKQSKVVEPRLAEILPESAIVQPSSAKPKQRATPSSRRKPALNLLHQIRNLLDNNMAQVNVPPRDNNELVQDEEEDYDEVLPSPNQFSIGINDFIMQILIFDKSKPIAIPKVAVYKNSKLSTNLVDTILKFSFNTYSVYSGNKNPHPDNNLIPLITWKACAYTIHSNEVSTRYKNKPLFGELSCRQKDCLEALVRVSSTLSLTWKKDYDINLHALRLLSLAIDNGGDNSFGILDWDAFGMLVSLTMTLPSLYYNEVPGPAPKGTVLDFHTLNLMFIANLVQIILTINIEEDSEEMLEMDLEEANDTRLIADLVYKLRGIHVKNTVAVWNLIESCAIPFLRCCSLFYHFLTGVAASSFLTEVNGDTYHNLCWYLGLPVTCKELLDQPYVQPLIDKWAENDKVIKIKHGETIPFKNWTHINELVQLPKDYSELINTVSMFTCPNNNHEGLRNPTMCLVCGAMLCSQNWCCQNKNKRSTFGDCSRHACTCSSGVGIFLRIRRCEVLLLASLVKGCLMPPPYLDKHGETDEGLERGYPLYLCEDRYRKLQLLWLDHELREEISKYIPNSLRF